MVDDEDFERLNCYSWSALWSPFTKSFYARRVVPQENGKQRAILMHRDVLGLGPSDKIWVDHRNHDTLDNQRNNLRKATSSQNTMNSTRRRGNNTSGFKGVSLRKKTGKWQAFINIDKKRVHLGFFDTAEEAYRIRQAKAIEVYGEFAA